MGDGEISIWNLLYEIAAGWMPQNLTNKKSTLGRHWDGYHAAAVPVLTQIYVVVWHH